MSKICGYSCEHNKSGVCQISGCDKKSIISDKTEVQTLRLDELDYTIVPNSDIKPLLDKLQQENKKLNGTIQTYDILLKANVEENKQLKDLIDTILNFSLFKEECPLNFGFENNTNEDKSQSIFYENQWCENNCNDNYKDCLLKYFKKLQEIEQGSDSNVKDYNGKD